MGRKKSNFCLEWQGYHSTAVIEDIVERLRTLDAANGTPEQFELLLWQMGFEAVARSIRKD